MLVLYLIALWLLLITNHSVVYYLDTRRPKQKYFVNVVTRPFGKVQMQKPFEKATRSED